MKFTENTKIAAGFYLITFLALMLANYQTIGWVCALLGVIVILVSIKSSFLTVSYLVLLAVILFTISDFFAGGVFLFGILSLQLFNKVVVLISKKQYKAFFNLIIVASILCSVGYGVAINLNPTESFQFYNFFNGAGASLICIVPLLKKNSKQINGFVNRFFE